MEKNVRPHNLADLASYIVARPKAKVPVESHGNVEEHGDHTHQDVAYGQTQEEHVSWLGVELLPHDSKDDVAIQWHSNQEQDDLDNGIEIHIFLDANQFIIPELWCQDFLVHQVLQDTAAVEGVHYTRGLARKLLETCFRSEVAWYCSLKTLKNLQM